MAHQHVSSQDAQCLLLGLAVLQTFLGQLGKIELGELEEEDESVIIRGGVPCCLGGDFNCYVPNFIGLGALQDLKWTVTMYDPTERRSKNHGMIDFLCFRNCEEFNLQYESDDSSSQFNIRSSMHSITHSMIQECMKTRSCSRFPAFPLSLYDEKSDRTDTHKGEIRCSQKGGGDVQEFDRNEKSSQNWICLRLVEALSLVFSEFPWMVKGHHVEESLVEREEKEGRRKTGDEEIGSYLPIDLNKSDLIRNLDNPSPSPNPKLGHTSTRSCPWDAEYRAPSEVKERARLGLFFSNDFENERILSARRRTDELSDLSIKKELTTAALICDHDPIVAILSVSCRLISR